MDVVASISDRVGDLGDYLREQRESARLSVRQLATLAGVSNPYLSQVERGLRRPSAEVLQQIAKGLRISAEALYIRAGILDSEGRPDVEAAVYADPYLNDRQRRVLLDIYSSFRAENERSVAEPVVAVQEHDDVDDPDGATTKAATARLPRKRVATRAAASVETTTDPVPSTGSTSQDAAEPVPAPAKRVARTRTRSS